MPIAVGPKRAPRAPAARCRAPAGSGSAWLPWPRAGWRRRSSIAARNCRCRPCPAKPAPGTSHSSVWMWIASGAAIAAAQRPRRRREAPAGDDGQNGHRHHAFEQDRPNQRSRVRGIASERRGEAKAVQRGEHPADSTTSASLIDRIMPVAGLDQRAESSRAGSTASVKPGQHQHAHDRHRQRREPMQAPQAAYASAATPSPPAAPARRPNKATPTPCRNSDGRVSHCGDAVAA